MANGPPTPPPTTDVEIQDAARDPEPAASSSAPAPPAPASTATGATAPLAAPSTAPQPDIWQAAFATVSLLAIAKEWEQLISYAEHADIAADDVPTRLLVAAPLVLAYLIKDELPAAKFALLRLSPRQQRLPLASALHRLMLSTTERHHSDVYARASEVPVDGDLNGVVHAEFGAVVAGMVESFCEHFRMRTFSLLSQAYSEISLSLAQTYLGMPEDSLLGAAEAYGWKYNAETNILSPIVTTQVTTLLSGTSTLRSFHIVSNSVSKLEI